MKYTRLVPLHKSGCLKVLGNFRPIALINTISKVFEELPDQKVYTFLEKLKILNDHQFGFRMNRSKVDALSIVSEEILEAKDNNKRLVALLLDSRKAFDTVNHSLKLEKLLKYELRVNVFIFWKVIYRVDINTQKYIEHFQDCHL